MENRRTHYFTDGAIVTGLCPNGQYGAYREQDDGRVRGYGPTRLSAIIDLKEAIGLPDLPPEENDAQTWKWDHDRDLRKHEE